jgi:hypothetical protein
MTQRKSEVRRIMLAITESSSLNELWSAVEENLAIGPAELITLFLSDDRWHRAASLPFTREFARLGGSSSDFTPQRADQVGKDAAQKAHARLQQLADDAKVRLAFERLEEHELTRLTELLTSESDVLIAPAFFKGQPLYAELLRLNCRILLIDSAE